MAEKPKSELSRFIGLFALLLIGGVVINVWERSGEASAPRKQLSEFPSQVGQWRQIGFDERFDKATEAVLRADDYISRNYATTDGRRGSFYAGYYATQRNGATYHSPLNCLPGSGWLMNEGATLAITPDGGGQSFEANRYIVQNGSDRQLLVYWYQGRGRVVASEYWGKVYTVLDSVGRRRSDGAMVRVMVSINGSEEAALKSAVELAGAIAPHLPEFIPN